MTASREEVAWLAGLLEGEGYFSISWQYSRPSFGISCKMTDKDVLEEARRIAGGKLYGPRFNGPGKKPFWVWQINHRASVRNLLVALRPTMGRRRAARIDLILTTMDEFPTMRRRRAGVDL